MFLILGPSDSDEVLYRWLPLVLRHLGSDWNSTSGFLEPLAYRQQIMGLLSLHETIPYNLHLCIYTYIYLYSFVSLDNSTQLFFNLFQPNFLSHYTVFRL